MKNYLIAIALSTILTNVAAQQASSTKVGAHAPQLSVYKWIKGQPIEHWNDKKIYLLEFGATWCAPCAAAIPELSALQKKYPDEVAVVSIFVMERNNQPINTQNPDYVKKVELYVAKRSDKINYSIAVDDPTGKLENLWVRGNGFSGIPQMFVIDRSGRIAWNGTDVGKARSMITAMMEEDSITIQKNIDAMNSKVEYDPKKLLLIENNGGKETDFVFRSILTRWDGKIRGRNTDFVQNYFWRKPDSLFDHLEDKFEVIGASLGKLYYIAYADTLANNIQFRNYYGVYTDTVANPYFRTSYGKYWHTPILEVENQSPFEIISKSPRHRYNYSLKVPEGTGTARYLQAAIQKDLEIYFGYAVSVETRSMPYWKLTLLDKERAETRLKSKDQQAKIKIDDDQIPFVFTNAEMRDIITMLGAIYGYVSLDYGKLPKSEQGAFIDETGINYLVDFKWDRTMTFEAMNSYLNELGLQLSKGHRPMKVVVIRDPDPE